MAQKGQHFQQHRKFDDILISGSVLHRGSAGNVATVNSDDIALMSAASGITHEQLHSPYPVARAASRSIDRH